MAILSDHSDIYKKNTIALVRGKQKTSSLWVGRLSHIRTVSGLSTAGAVAHHSCKVRFFLFPLGFFFAAFSKLQHEVTLGKAELLSQPSENQLFHA